MLRDYQIDPMYLVSDKGEVFSKFTGSFLKPSLLANGYYHVNVRNGNGVRVPRPIHRMVAETFIEPVKGKYHVNHKDGDKLNNCVENLEWCTNAENRAHAKANGLIARGDTHGKSKLTEHTVIRICELFSQGYTATEVMEMLADVCEISRATLYNIRSRRDWVEVSENYDWPRHNTANKRSKRATTISKESRAK